MQTLACAPMMLVSTTDHAGGWKTLRFIGRWDDTIPEDRRLVGKGECQGGHIELEIDNPIAVRQFKNGESYWVYFAKAPTTSDSVQAA